MSFAEFLEVNIQHSICARILRMTTSAELLETTVFIRIVAAATINFSLAWMRLLIEGGFY